MRPSGGIARSGSPGVGGVRRPDESRRVPGRVESGWVESARMTGPGRDGASRHGTDWTDPGRVESERIGPGRADGLSRGPRRERSRVTACPRTQEQWCSYAIDEARDDSQPQKASMGVGVGVGVAAARGCGGGRGGAGRWRWCGETVGAVVVEAGGRGGGERRGPRTEWTRPARRQLSRKDTGTEHRSPLAQRPTSASFARNCSTDLVWIWLTRLSVTPRTLPISASVRPS